MNWLPTNIVPAWNDSAWTSISGGASIDNEKITLPVNSTMRLKLDKGEILPGSSYLRFMVEFEGTFDSLEEYDPNFTIDIKVTYLDNKIQTTKIVLSRLVSVGTRYLDDIALSMELKNISSMEVFFNNRYTALGTLYIKSISIYKSEDVNKSQVASAVSEVVSLKKLTSYDNGCVIEWKGDIKDLKLEFIKGISNEFLGILVDDEDFIQYERIAGILP